MSMLSGALGLLLFVGVLLAQPEYYDDTPDCLDVSNTTVPRTSCTVNRCECHLCFRNGNFTTSFCIYATNTTLFADNATWVCPSITNTTLEHCRDAMTRATILVWCLVGTTFLIAALLIGGAKLLRACCPSASTYDAV